MPTTIIDPYVNVSIRRDSKNGKCNDFLAFSYNYEHYPFLKVLEKFAFTIIALMKYEIWAAKSRE